MIDRRFPMPVSHVRAPVVAVTRGFLALIFALGVSVGFCASTRAVVLIRIGE